MTVPVLRGSDLLDEYSSLRAEELRRLLPIQTAFEENNMKAVPGLIRSLDAPMCYLHHQLQRAMRRMDVAGARYLLTANVPIDSSVVNALISHAVGDPSSIPMFRLLIKYGYDITAQTCNSPLLCQVMGDEKLVKWLLKHGANPCYGLEITRGHNYRDLCEQSGQVIESAASWGSLKTLNRLIKYGACYDLGLPLHCASWVEELTPERKAVMERLISLGRDVNENDLAWGNFSRGTPLFCAAEFGCIETMELLLHHGADPDFLNCWGNTADYEALLGGRHDNAKLIEDWRAGIRLPPDEITTSINVHGRVSRIWRALYRWFRTR